MKRSDFKKETLYVKFQKKSKKTYFFKYIFCTKKIKKTKYISEIYLYCCIIKISQEKNKFLNYIKWLSTW